MSNEFNNRNQEKEESKADKLAKIMYDAMVRYVNAKKSLIREKKPNFRLDSKRVWREDKFEDID